jgi:hypothetical protein
MSVNTITARIFVCALMMVAFSQAASAYCDLLVYSAAGSSVKEAIAKANAKGLVEVHRLNSKYGSHVKYDKATWQCSSGSPVSCIITQRYCVAGLDETTASHNCGPDKVWLGGKCVAKEEHLKQVIILHGCPENLDKSCLQTPSGKLIHCHCQS